jgi:hypothetical protein
LPAGVPLPSFDLVKPIWLVLGTVLVVALRAAEPTPLFAEDFSKVPAGELPDPPFKLLDGQFAVTAEGDNQFVELPGAPLESYGFLFGPSQPSGVAVSARIWGTKTGRKFPTFAVGLNGASGYRLQVTPAKNAVELFKGETAVATANFKWISGEWTQLRLALRPAPDGTFILEGAAWPATGTAPDQPLVTFTEAKLQPAGKAGAWGLPFSGTPIRFDDLKVTKLN